MLLEIKKLKVKIEGKEILKGIDLKIKKGEILALLGPNASGKSTLAKVLSGDTKYKVESGRILFNGKNITNLLPEKRVKLGIALSWQNPPAIKGVKLSELLKKISRKEVNLKEDILNRDVNLNFSGGEKKISELFQILVLNPKLVIFDEIDSGLDLEKLKDVSKTIKKELVDKGVAIIFITHSGEVLKFLKPNIVNVMIGGRIICRQKDFKKVFKTIKRYGYDRCKKYPLFANQSQN